MQKPIYDGISVEVYDQLESNMIDAGKIQETDCSDECEVI